MHKRIASIISALLLIGCSDGAPMRITEQTSSYVGAWQYRYENIQRNSTNIDNLLLIIRQDGKAIYRRCVLDQNKSEHYKGTLRKEVSFSEAAVTEIMRNKIVIVQKQGWFGFKSELNIDKTPYQENGDWYMDVEGRKLVKLLDQDIQEKTNWTCPDDDV